MTDQNAATTVPASPELTEEQLAANAVKEELTLLKARADKMNIKYHPSIGLQTLKDKIKEIVSETPKLTLNPVHKNVSAGETTMARNMKARHRAEKLVRVKLTCLNPAKKDWEGEIFTAGNSQVGSFKKYVPFDNMEGWHVPQIILNMISERECQLFVNAKDSRGNRYKKGKIIKEFSVTIMEPLSAKEIEDLARKQAMANNIDT